MTPYVTGTTEIDSIETVETTVVEQTPLPVNTPTPVVHTVALGETISSIALQYGVTIDAIIAANPDIQPTVMIVGDTVIIPVSSTNTVPFIAEEFADDIKLSNPTCFPALDGLLCTVLVKNTGENNFKERDPGFSPVG